MMSLKEREFTRTSIFYSMREIVLREHLPYVLPIVFSTTLNNINWSIGLEVRSRSSASPTLTRRPSGP